MKKKNYIHPEMQVIILKSSAPILTTSSLDVMSTDYTEGDDWEDL